MSRPLLQSCTRRDTSERAGEGPSRGTKRRSPPHEGLERVIWQAIHGHIAPGALAASGPVDTALNELRRHLRSRGLIRPFLPSRAWLPARSRHGRQALREAARGCPTPPEGPVDRSTPDPRRSVGIPVALHGELALANLFPRFAADSGLLTRSSSDLTIADENSPTDRTDYVPGM